MMNNNINWERNCHFYDIVQLDPYFVTNDII